MKTDLEIQRDVLAELLWEPSVNAAEIGVEVQKGIVTLDGQVDSYAAKIGAEKAAQRVAGVIALAVEMTVKIPGISARTDADIARSAEQTLRWTAFVGKDTVKVMVEHGWVTLSGQVEWDYQRHTAENAVRYLLGVTGMSNQISVKPKISQAAVKTEIEAALKRRASVDAGKISVGVKGSDVTLSGSVHSLSERETARRSAWSTPGVSHVIDHLVVCD